jgi:Ala-tRNA(Pro) deacylase
MRGQKELYELFERLAINFEYHEHPPLATIKDARIHYLVILEHLRLLNIRDLEKRLKQGKLTFASDKRLKKYLGVEPGSVSPFGLINDTEHHVHLFIDEKLNESDRLAFHPNINTASLVISKKDFIRFLQHTGNAYEFIKLYD